MTPPRALFSIVAALICCIGLSACSDKPPMTPAETALRLLAMHGMLGKNPEQRSTTAKNTLIDADELQTIFVDLSNYDKFSGELFTGVILGALARNQSRLLEIKNATTAEVTAGHAVIHFDRIDNVWKINLDRTIPDEMKKRAQSEKKRYEAAKAAGTAATQAP